MNVIELRDKINEFIALGRGEEPVLFDSDAMCFDQHMIEIDDVSWEDPKELSDEFNGFWLHFNWEHTKCHYNVSNNKLIELQAKILNENIVTIRELTKENNVLKRLHKNTTGDKKSKV